MAPFTRTSALVALITLGACDAGLALDDGELLQPAAPTLRSFGSYRAILADGDVPTPQALDPRALVTAHDFHLPPASCAAAVCPVAHATSFTDLDTGETVTISALALATASPEPELPPSAHHILVVDLSASMATGRIEATRAALRLALDAMSPDDRVTLVQFSDAASVPVTALPPSAPELLAAVDALDPAGKANLAAGLSAALDAADTADASGARQPHLILLTDGPPTAGETDLTVLVEQVDLAARAGLTLDVLALGVDVPRPALAAMAEAGGGRFAWAEAADQASTLLPPLAADVPMARAVEARLATTGVGALTWVGTTRPPPDATSPWQLPVVGLPYGSNATPPVLLLTPGEQAPTFELSYLDPATGQPVTATQPPEPDGAALDGDAAAFEPALAWVAAVALERASTRTVAGDLDGAREALAIATGILAPYADDPDVARDLADLERFLDNLSP